MSHRDFQDALALVRERRLAAFGEDDYAYALLSRITTRLQAAAVMWEKAVL